MNKSPRFVLALGVLVFSGGCPLLDVAVDVEEVCLTYPDVAVEGHPGGLAVSRSFSFDDLDAVHEIIERDGDVRFVRGEVRAKTGVDNFAFVDSARIIVSSGDPASALPPLTVYNCDGDCLPDGNKLALDGSVQESAIEYVKSDSLVVDIDLVGRLPSEAWTMDVDVCLKGHLEYAFEP